MLQLCAKDNLFLFNSETFFQIDGAPMGGCVSPTLADIFMGFHEQVWLNNCPNEFKPVFYRRYVDDTFLLFRSPSHVQLFLTYLNSQDQSIEFSSESEKNYKISFLDITIDKFSNDFSTSLYRKPTFTGLFTKFNSAISNSYKYNLILYILDRAYKLCSTYLNFTNEIENIRKYFGQND